MWDICHVRPLWCVTVWSCHMTDVSHHRHHRCLTSQKPLWCETSLISGCDTSHPSSVTQDVRPLGCETSVILSGCETSPDVSHILDVRHLEGSHIWRGDLSRCLTSKMSLCHECETSWMWDICDPLCVTGNLSDVRPLWCVTVWSCETCLSMMMDSIITLYMSTTFCDDSVITESISSCKTQQFFVLFTTRVNNRRVTVHVTVNESTLLTVRSVRRGRVTHMRHT